LFLAQLPSPWQKSATNFTVFLQTIFPKRMIKQSRAMPDTETACRNRALVAFTLLTGARDSAIPSLKLKHVDLIAGCVNQDAREVNTKFGKTFSTFFFPVGEEVQGIVEEWVSFLREEKLGAMMIRSFR
jgi:integrase